GIQSRREALRGCLECLEAPLDLDRADVRTVLETSCGAQYLDRISRCDYQISAIGLINPHTSVGVGLLLSKPGRKLRRNPLQLQAAKRLLLGYAIPFH